MRENNITNIIANCVYLQSVLQSLCDQEITLVASDSNMPLLEQVRNVSLNNPYLHISYVLHISVMCLQDAYYVTCCASTVRVIEAMRKQ